LASGAGKKASPTRRGPGDLTPFGHVIAGGVERFVYHARAGGEVVPGEGDAYEWLPTLDDRPFVPQDAAVLGNFLARHTSKKPRLRQ
jgi:hypothetical protein